MISGRMLPALALLVLGAAVLLDGRVSAAGYPDRPIRWVVPYPPGGTTDVIARNVAQALTQKLGWTIVIDNRGGAGGQLAMSAVAKSAPDGYTLLVSDASLATAASLYKQLSFDPVTDLRSVVLLVTVPHIVVVNPAVQANSLNDLIALTKKAPGALNFGSGGLGSPLHLAGEALRLETGMTWTHIPYRGAGPAIIGSIANEVQIATPSLPAVLSLVQSGKLRALAAMSPQRLVTLPDVPTVGEAGYPKATVLGWIGLHAPEGTSADILRAIETSATGVMQSVDLREKITGQGADGTPLGSAAYGKFVADQTARWRQVVQAAGIEPQ
jgi:tripartite-type tricarboxylate transporter receptor subunit TctC